MVACCPWVGSPQRVGVMVNAERNGTETTTTTTTNITAIMKITVILAITCINRSDDLNNKRDSHTDEVCVFVSRLFQSEGDLRLQCVSCSVHLIRATSVSIQHKRLGRYQALFLHNS